MINCIDRITVRSVSPLSRARLVALRGHTRLTYGSLVDDAVEALWQLYIEEGHELPELQASAPSLSAAA